LGHYTGDPISRPICGRVRLSSDVREIKLVFSIPPHRPTRTFREWAVSPRLGNVKKNDPSLIEPIAAAE
jgi:hypothetical protein